MQIKETLRPEEDNAFMVAGTVDCFLRYKDLFLDCVLYDDLMQDPEGVTKRFFARIGIDTNLVSLALTALQKHSQNNMFTKDDCTVISKEGWIAADRALERMGSPLRVNMPMEDLQKLLKV